MERDKIRMSSIMCLYILLFFSSCTGHETSKVAPEEMNERNATISIGDTVSDLDKSIWIIFQDKNNHYWFGSDGQGVFRYDGQLILNFTTKDGLVNDRIRGIQEDKLGNIYISTLTGISKFDGKSFSTLPVTESKEWKQDPNDLWFSMLGKTGEDGPYRFDGKVLHHLKFPKHYMEEEYFAANGKRTWSPYEPYTIYKDNKGNIWFGTSAFGIGRYDGKSFGWMYEKHLTLIEGGGSFGIRSIIEDKDGKFWFCNTSYRYNILPGLMHDADKYLINYTREKGIDDLKTAEGKNMIYFMSVVKDDHENLWMLTYEQGVWRYDGEHIIHYPIKAGSEDLKLFSIYKDKQGDLWLGTHEAGAYKFNGKSFERFIP